MGFKLESDTAVFSAEITRFQNALEADLATLGTTVQTAALERANQGLERSVYGTQPGRYKRTGNLRRFLNSSLTTTKVVLTLQLRSSMPYSSQVEFGTGPSALSARQVQDYAEVTGGQVLYFGRSGAKYLMPGPFLLPASVWALETAKREFEAITVRHWR